MSDVTILDELVQLSRALGDPARDWVILGEGNTSARAGDGTFWVKASGTTLRDAAPDSFVRVRARDVRALLEDGGAGDAEVRDALASARVDPGAAAMPSVETFLHAVCLGLDGVRFVGHTHPTAINAITCARAFEDALAGRLFPDEIVLCGPSPVLVPYVDPGVPLACELARRLAACTERPRAIYLQNHGFVALGATAKQVEDVTAMAVKAARILLGTYAAGGPRFMPAEQVERIHVRPDEAYRRRVLGQEGGATG